LNTIAQATEFLRAGVGIFPIGRRDKRPEFSMLPIDPADQKPTWEPFKTILPTMSQVQGWFNHGLENYAVISGWQNLVVLDFDDAQEYVKWSLWVKDNPAALWTYEHAYKVRTARGVHVYIRTSMPERARKLGKIDIKAGGGYVLGPGSIHPSGAIYTPLTNNLFFPLVNSLSEILPIEILTRDPTIATSPKVQQPPATLDPWARASNPQQILSSSGGEDLITKIRKHFKVEDFFTNPVQTGNHWLMVPCPFHTDKHPSFWIDTQKQICGCFAGCTTKPMDVINLYARLYSLDNRAAILSLAARVHP
jgi:hypothetical protein